MSRGLGSQQRIVLKALRALEREHGPGWFPVGEVVGAVERLTGAGRNRGQEHLENADRLQLEHAREMVAQGVYMFRQTVYIIESRMNALKLQRRREATLRAPNTVRREPRAGEGGNPSRVLAALARRGLVERQAHRGPGSSVRLPASFVRP